MIVIDKAPKSNSRRIVSAQGIHLKRVRTMKLPVGRIKCLEVSESVEYESVIVSSGEVVSYVAHGVRKEYTERADTLLVTTLLNLGVLE